MADKLKFGTQHRIDYRSGKHVIVRRTAMSYDRLMQVVTQQAMEHGIPLCRRK